MSWVEKLARPDIVAMKPYEHALWDPALERLHANELPWRSMADASVAGLNRYPEPQPRALVERLAALYGVAPESVLVARGSDEAIDLLARSFCTAGRDSVIVCPPTFGIYALAARIQGAQILAVPLRADRNFALDEPTVLERCVPGVKLLFLCSPNNPTGNLLEAQAVLRVARALEGKAVVVVDEAYIEFSAARSLASLIGERPNLAILRTLSKAYALAGARCGAVIADSAVITLLRKVIPPYALPQLSVEAVLKILEPGQLSVSKVHLQMIATERNRLESSLRALPSVTRVWESAANFLLVEFKDPSDALARVRSAGLLIRDVRGYPGLGQCLRITIGTVEQNQRVLQALR
ncbi:MAG: histidinol-phosphate transaminase [Steroidobacteraceae bacterium]